MVLELILAYGLLVGAIVGMDHVLPGYERDQSVTVSKAQVPGHLNGQQITPVLEELESNIAIGEAAANLTKNMQSNMDQSVDEQDRKANRESAMKVLDEAGNVFRGETPLSSTKSKTSYDVFRDEGFDEQEARYEKWAK